MNLSKNDLKEKVEPGIWHRLSEKNYKVQWLHPKELVTWNRFDIGMRTLYLRIRDHVPKLADKIYYEDLKAQSLGTMVDPDNSNKNSWEAFQEVFDTVANSIAEQGFDPSKTLLPVSATGSILNGGHRLSAALVYGKEVSCVYTDLPPITCDYKYFFDRDVPADIIERAARQLIRYAEHVFLAFLWPSGADALAQTEKLFDKIIYKKIIHLKGNAPFNLLYQCYHHMDWVGKEASGYQGLQQKRMECFPGGEGEVLVIAFQATGGVPEVRAVKERIREINGIGYSSVHITDTKEEAIRISEIVFNENGRHYLNYAQPITAGAKEILEQLLNRAVDRGVDPEYFMVDGSWLLELYGIRNAEDIDIVASSAADDVYQTLSFEARQKEMVFHGKSEEELIFDSANHFQLFGIKLVGFCQLQHMKTARGQPKDKNDVKLMACLVENRPWQAMRVRLKQKMIYARLRTRKKFFSLVRKLLKLTGLYHPVRIIWQAVSAKKMK